MDWEHRMDAATERAPTAQYTTSHRIQAWFLGRSRDRWKEKYADLKADVGRLKRRVADMAKSREKWRLEAIQARQRAKDLEAQNAMLQEQAVALKKDGPSSGPRLG
jgi:hypothetical protein